MWNPLSANLERIHEIVPVMELQESENELLSFAVGLSDRGILANRERAVLPNESEPANIFPLGVRLYNELCMKKKYRRTVSWKKRNRKN